MLKNESKYLLGFSAILIILVISCSSKSSCNRPYIRVGENCCLDQNHNSICDKDEKSISQEDKVAIQSIETKPVCGNDRCESSETQLNCCVDCGCPQGYSCDLASNKCLLNKPDLKLDVYSSSQSATLLYSLPEEIINARRPLLTVHIQNNGTGEAKDVQVKAKLGEFSDWNVKNIGDIKPFQKSWINITPRANSNILSLTTETNVLVQIKLVYEDLAAQKYEKDYTTEAVIEGRNTFSWFFPELTASWVTLSDPIIRDFATEATNGLAPAYVAEDILPAIKRIFDEVGAFGVRYASDPTGVWGDYLQFPVETLHRKNGDCDDMAVLFAALLQAVGINAGVVLVPGHAYTWFELNNTKYALEGTSVGRAPFYLRTLNESLKGLNESQYDIIDPYHEWQFNNIKTVNLPTPPTVSVPQIIISLNYNEKSCGLEFGGKWYHCKFYVIFSNTGGQGYRCLEVSNYEKEKAYLKLRDTQKICTDVPTGTTTKEVDLDADFGKTYTFDYRVVES